MSSFNKLVAEKINGQNISLRKAAKEIGIDPSFLSKVLAGKRSPPWDEKILKKLAKVLDIDPALLIVSTGRIPSELQASMENPKVLQSLMERSFHSPELPVNISQFKNNTKKISPVRKKTNEFAGFPKSVTLSEDLL